MKRKNSELYLTEIADDGVNAAATMQLPDPTLYFQYHFMSERKIVIDYEIDETLMDSLRLIMMWNAEDKKKGLSAEEREPIRVYLMSGGGVLDYCWALIDAIEQSVTPVYTYNLGVAASAAGLIFMAGHKRFMMPRATVMIHEGSASFSGDAGKLMDATDSYKAILKEMRTFIVSKTKITPAMLSRKKANDWEIKAPQCLELGVCDEIVQSMDEMV